MRPIKCALAIVILLLAQSAIANSAEDHIQLGLDALKRGDYGAAITLWRPRAEQGDIDAQFHLGHLHDQRWGVPQDYAEAAKWYRRAAEQGHARAQYNLGSMYEDGRGVARDDAAAVRLYCRAIRQNDPQAWSNSDRCMARGEASPPTTSAPMCTSTSPPNGATELQRWNAMLPSRGWRRPMSSPPGAWPATGRSRHRVLKAYVDKLLRASG